MGKRVNKVAFFDIDGTLFRWSLFIEYVELLFSKGILDPSLKKGYENEYKAWVNREGVYEDYINAMVKVFHSNSQGIHIDEFRQVVKEALESKEKRVYRFTRDLIKDLKEKGYFLVAISHSAKIAVDIFAENYGFDKVYGLRFELDDSKHFTGKVMDKEEIFNKASIVKRVLEKYKLSLKDSYAVGDTASDAPMLELVDNPIAFNPNKELYEIAKKKGWKIVVERKDVVYQI